MCGPGDSVQLHLGRNGWCNMTFKSKRDKVFTGVMLVAMMIIAVVTLVPIIAIVLSADETEWAAITLLLATLIFSCGLILWVWLDIEYTFYDDYLFVKGGIFRSKIPYDEIIKINESSNILVGYRILASKDALEIHYKYALLGSVIISPKPKAAFIAELQKRCPQLKQ